MSRTEPEGRSVWEGCPFAPGTLVYLYVSDMPEMALRFGDYESRKPRANPGSGPLGLPGPPRWVNGPLDRRPVFFDVPVQVGCNLAVIPAWDSVFVEMATALDLPAPTYGSNEGVDVRCLDSLEVWAFVAPNEPEEIRAFPWVRHPLGFWGQPSNLLAAPSLPGHHFVVPCKDADRLYCQVQYTTAFTAGGGVAYGRMTPPPEYLPDTANPQSLRGIEADEQIVRFGAVLASAERAE
jgi:hypothetical protein